ncbi:MAG: DUF1156 domain-containing protein [Deltaproteobacteria bacterium]
MALQPSIIHRRYGAIHRFGTSENSVRMCGPGQGIVNATAVQLDAINKASVREKSIRHGHPSTLHLWWARRPLAAARARLKEEGGGKE